MKKFKKCLNNEIEVNGKFYKIINLIDRTKRSEVFKVKKENKFFAYKVTYCEKDFMKNHTKNPKIVDSPNVLNLIDFEYNEKTKKLKMITEYYPFPDLFYYVETEIIQEEKLKVYIKNIALRVKECHDKDVIHLDIKPENFVLKSNDPLDLVLLDFEFSVNLNDKKSKHNNQCGTPGYCSPEMIMHNTYSKKSDIWAIGACAYVLFTHFEPSIQEKRFNVHWGDKLEKMNLGKKYSKEFVDFLNKTMYQLPYRRPTIEELLAHPWLN